MVRPVAPFVLTLGVGVVVVWRQYGLRQSKLEILSPEPSSFARLPFSDKRRAWRYRYSRRKLQLSKQSLNILCFWSLEILGGGRLGRYHGLLSSGFAIGGSVYVRWEIYGTLLICLAVQCQRYALVESTTSAASSSDC
jgi:hypothetical protein